MLPVYIFGCLSSFLNDFTKILYCNIVIICPIGGVILHFCLNNLNFFQSFSIRTSFTFLLSTMTPPRVIIGSIMNKANLLKKFCFLNKNDEETHKSGGVVISDGFGVSKSLQSRVGLDDLIFQSTLHTSRCVLFHCLKWF